MRSLILIYVCLLLTVPCQARIITVDDDGPADFNSIQAAIVDANEGDMVEVAPGIYSGDGNRDIDFEGKVIIIRSKSGPEGCIIDCYDRESQYQHRGFYFHSGEGSNSVLSGFTITNGRVGSCPKAPGGGGILCSLSSPTITDCVIVNNQSVGWCRPFGSAGGGIFLDRSSPTIVNCIIAGNVSNEGGEGGGMFCLQSSPTITNCTICDNSGDGVMCYDASCPVITNSIFWGNSSGQIVAESRESYVGSSTPVVAFSDVQGGWPGQGNLNADPCFVDAASGNYHLKSQAGRWSSNSESWNKDDVTSPCIDAGDLLSPIGQEPFPNGGIINMGAYGGTNEASKSYFGKQPCEIIVAGDVNGDCEVNFLDFRLMALHWCENNRE